MTFSRTCLFAALALSLTVIAAKLRSAQDDIRKRGDRACGGDSRQMCSKFSARATWWSSAACSRTRRGSAATAASS